MLELEVSGKPQSETKVILGFVDTAAPRYVHYSGGYTDGHSLYN